MPPQSNRRAVGYADLRLAVVSPFVDRKHGTERALAELLERLARDYNCEIHLYAQSVDDVAISDPRSARIVESPASTAGAIFWHKVPSIPGPHLLQFLGWIFFNGFLRRWHTTSGGASYDLVFSPGINSLHPDVVIVHALFHRLRELSREENNDSAAKASFFRRLHRRASPLHWIKSASRLRSRPKPRFYLPRRHRACCQPFCLAYGSAASRSG